jgi:hypothetical protein
MESDDILLFSMEECGRNTISKVRRQTRLGVEVFLRETAEKRLTVAVLIGERPMGGNSKSRFKAFFEIIFLSFRVKYL